MKRIKGEPHVSRVFYGLVMKIVLLYTLILLKDVVVL